MNLIFVKLIEWRVKHMMKLIPADIITKITGVLAILTGLLQMTGMAPDFINPGTIQGWELVLYGLGLIGIGRKLERIANSGGTK